MPKKRKPSRPRRRVSLDQLKPADIAAIEVIKGPELRAEPRSEPAREGFEWAERYNRVRDLIDLLRRCLREESEDAETDDQPCLIPGWLLEAVIEELEQRPDPRAIRGPAKLREAHALLLLRARKERLLHDNKKSLSALDAEWEVAENGVDLFRRYTGRTISPDRLRRLMQNAPRTDAKSPTSRR